MKRILILLIVLTTFVRLSFSQGSSLPSSTVSATQSGNASVLATGFNENVELILPNQNGVFSKSQAEYIMADFFRQNPPTAFSIIHQGQRENSSYAIGKYSCASGAYRFQFLTKSEGGALLIKQLRIEKQDE